MSEWILRDLAAVSDFRYVSLRYFNVAGSDPQGRIGQATRKATLLIKVACEAVVGKRPHVSIYGTDYETPDGTGMRDYIHVEDLARAHLDALDYLRRGGASGSLNCGYGHGYSVREVLASVQRVAGKPLSIKEEPRRAGDPPTLVAARRPRALACSAGRRSWTISTRSSRARCAGRRSSSASPGRPERAPRPHSRSVQWLRMIGCAGCSQNR